MVDGQQVDFTCFNRCFDITQHPTTMSTGSDYDEKVACRLGQALYHFASVLRIPQAEYLQQFLEENVHLASGSEDEIKVLVFGNMEKFENRWIQIVDQFTEDRKRLQSFHEMDEYLMKMDDLCNKTLKTFEDYMRVPISARSAIKTIIRGIFPIISMPLQWRSLDYFEFYLNQINQDMYDMYEYTRLLEPRYSLGSESNTGGINCEKLHNRLEELETRALHPPSENATSQRKQERYDAITGDLGPEEQQPAQAKTERKELLSKNNIFERDFQWPNSYNVKKPFDADSNASDDLSSTSSAFHFDDATLADEEPLVRGEDDGEEGMPTSGASAFMRNINNHSDPPQPQADSLGMYSDASNRSSLSSRLSPSPPSYHPTSNNASEKSLDLGERFEQDPFFAITTKYINPTQYFLLRRGNCEVPFRVVRGGIKGDVWSFVVNLTYTTEQMRQLLQSCRPTDNEMAEDLVQTLVHHPSSIHKRLIAAEKGGILYKVVDVYIEEEWKFGLERKVTFDVLKSMLGQSLRMEKGSETLWM
ncbi:hypothetical protein IW261DRAFT_1502041 [Armillaria novae-zelandiae]|uniref:Uncharacterized protein n=1 Tax=Armillaria novae-zelandiae TaxID=153914 RepID=A0AA39NY88_9AGAR|nr:hypothetical protein IW261DRAFT_1502041 [Armillaria novae-zelandiae]